MSEVILMAGYGRADITPDYPVHMQGGNWRGRVSTGILDTLYATCIALTTGEQTVLLYTTDLKLVTKNFSEVTRDEISAATGVPRENIYLSATHTHSSVAIRYPWEGVEEYRAFFNRAAVQAAQDAMADRAPSQIYTGTTETEGLNFVRHYLMNDGTVCGSNFGSTKSGYVGHIKEPDRQMQLVHLRRENKKDILMIGFPCHGTFKESGTLLSADYIGPAREYAEANSDCHFALFQGSCGDQTPGSRLGLAIKDYAEHGQKVAQYALDAIPTLTPCPAGELKIAAMEFTAPTNKKKLEKLQEALEVVELVEAHGATSDEVKAAVKKYHFHSRHEANWVRIRANAGDEKSMEIGVFSIGELAFVLAPYEMFGDQGRYIKSHAPQKTAFIVGCMDGGYNYLPSKEAFDYDCYESQCSFFERGTAERLAETYVEMLNDLKK